MQAISTLPQCSCAAYAAILMAKRLLTAAATLYVLGLARPAVAGKGHWIIWTSFVRLFPHAAGEKVLKLSRFSSFWGLSGTLKYIPFIQQRCSLRLMTLTLRTVAPQSRNPTPAVSQICFVHLRICRQLHKMKISADISFRSQQKS